MFDEIDDPEHYTLDDVPDHVEITRVEWDREPQWLQLLCGCFHYTFTGDILWMIFDDEEGRLVPVEIETVTVH